MLKFLPARSGEEDAFKLPTELLFSTFVHNIFCGNFDPYQSIAVFRKHFQNHYGAYKKSLNKSEKKRLDPGAKRASNNQKKAKKKKGGEESKEEEVEEEEEDEEEAGVEGGKKKGGEFFFDVMDTICKYGPHPKLPEFPGNWERALGASRCSTLAFY